MKTDTIGMKEKNGNDRPPLGVMPKYLWNEKRIEALGQAIIRYIECERVVPKEWIEEYNEILEMWWK